MGDKYQKWGKCAKTYLSSVCCFFRTVSVYIIKCLPTPDHDYLAVYVDRKHPRTNHLCAQVHFSDRNMKIPSDE